MSTNIPQDLSATDTNPRKERKHVFPFIESPRVIFTCGIILFSIYMLLLKPSWLPQKEAPAVSLVVITLGLWATGIIPVYVTSLMFFLSAILLKIAPANVVFSGFESPAWWLVLGGLMIGAAIQETGLINRFAGLIAHFLSSSYPRVISSVFVVNTIIGFVMPSAMARLILLVPISIALANGLGFKEGSNGRTGVVLATIFGGYFPAFAVLTSNTPNVILLGTTEKLFNYSPGYGEYILLHFPVLGFLKSIVVILLIVFLLPDRPDYRPSVIDERKPWTRKELILSLVLTLTVGLWCTDFLHHISPAWIALASGVFCLLPPFRLISEKSFKENISFGTLIFIASILALGSLLSYTGLGNLIISDVMKLLPLRHDANIQNAFILSLNSIIVSVFTTAPGVPAVLTPVAGEIARNTGLSLHSVIMTEVLGYSTTLFLYQAPPMVVGMQISGEPLDKAIKYLLYIATATIVFLLPLNLLWWRLLGWI